MAKISNQRLRIRPTMEITRLEKSSKPLSIHDRVVNSRWKLKGDV
jgi:hypothetical protein